MPRFDPLWRLISRLRRQESGRPPLRGDTSPIAFQELRAVEHPPKQDAVAAGEMYYVHASTQPRWLMFRCPCTCGSVITLSLQKVHRPHWSVKRSREGRPSLYPSVWRDAGCCSHFWVDDGRVYWCPDTGTPLTLRRHGDDGRFQR